MNDNQRAYDVRALDGFSEVESGSGVRRTPAPAPVEQMVERALRRWDLTPSEANVLRSLLLGHGNVEAAKAAGCKVKTVESHVTRMLKKAGAPSRLALAAMCWLDWTSEAQAQLEAMRAELLGA